MRQGSIGILLLLIATEGVAQSQISGGLLPELTISRTFGQDWKASLQLESMQALYSGNTEDGSSSSYEYIRTDFTTMVSRRMNPNVSVAAGYMARATESRWVQRTIQQISWVQRQAAFRIGQRIRTDQTYADGTNPIYRARYRLALDIPLQGLSLDVGEFYLIPSYEQLGVERSSEWDGESRLLARIGKLINEDLKLELGLDHRFDGYVQGEQGHRTWLMMNAFLTH